ncbi:MAG: hypothetical protein RLZ02_1848 [Actinomycetota bacterium]
MELTGSESKNAGKIVTKTNLHNQVDDFAFWLEVSPAERVAAVKVLRQRVFGYPKGVV